MNPFKKNKKQISIFITAGYPNLNSLPNQILFLQNEGIDFIEVGIPFSDPLADGPTIQETSSIALENGMNMDLLFEQLQSIRKEIRVPIVLMGYLNPVLQYGLKNFLEKCKLNGIASVILPDMSIDLYNRFYRIDFEAFSIPVSFLITVDSTEERILEISRVSTNSFIYMVSHASTTGGSLSLNDNIQQRFKEIKKICGDTPLFMGFGIQSKEDIEAAQLHCDGAIIGTSYLKSLKIRSQKEFMQKILN